MSYKLSKLIQCIGYLLMPFIILVIIVESIIFESIMWLIERIFGDE